MSLLSNTSVLLGKELRTEFRSRELLTTTCVFIVIVLVLFSFTVNPGPKKLANLPPVFSGWPFFLPPPSCFSPASCANRSTTP
jgi:hypothetical protein